MSKFEEYEELPELNEEVEEMPEPRKTAGERFHNIWKLLYRLRSVFLAIPVAVTAVILAIRNAAMLPAQVGIDMQPNGEFMYLMDKSVAVLIPLAITGVCLLLTFFTKRVAYPWLVSVFSLLLPIVLLLINTFPG